MEKPLSKPPYYDGSGSLYRKGEKDDLNRSDQIVITPEMQKNLSGNPYIASK